MKNFKKPFIALIACATLLASCGGQDISSIEGSGISASELSLSVEQSNSSEEIKGETITEEEGIKLLTEMSAYIEEKFDLVSDEPPAEFLYIYIESDAYSIHDGIKQEGTGIVYISMEEGNRFSYTKENIKGGELTGTQESYVVEHGASDWAAWDVVDGVAGEVDHNSMNALGVVLVYAFMLASTLPDMCIEELASENTTALSFVKYSDVDLDVKYVTDYSSEEVSEEEEEEETVAYSKEETTISYRNRFATSRITDRYDENGNIIEHQKMDFKFAKADIPTPVPPTPAN